MNVGTAHPAARQVFHRPVVVPLLEVVNNLDGFGKQFLCDVPDPRCAVDNHGRVLSLAEPAASGFSQNSLGKLGTDLAGIRRGCTLNGRRVGPRRTGGVKDAPGGAAKRTL